MLWLVGHALGIAATALLFATMFKLLVESHVPRRSLWEGALLGAVGFELLKGLANFLLGQTKGQPAFQAFGVALIVVVWINYFSRLVMYAAAYAYTSPEALERRTAEAMRAPGAAVATSEPEPEPVAATPLRDEDVGEDVKAVPRPARGSGPAVLAGGLLGLAAVGVVTARRRRD
jgi:membrane protein